MCRHRLPTDPTSQGRPGSGSAEGVGQGGSPARRDLHLFMLLTGMRRTATCQALAAHVDLQAAALHVPRPKGGEDRAFDVPLSTPLVDLLRHRLAENEAIDRGTPWLFPSITGKGGHMMETGEGARRPTRPRIAPRLLELGARGGRAGRRAEVPSEPCGGGRHLRLPATWGRSPSRLPGEGVSADTRSRRARVVRFEVAAGA
jgi:integrase